MDRNYTTDLRWAAHAHTPADAGSGTATIAGNSAAQTAEESGGQPPVCVIGLGYVGLPLALAFDATGRQVIGFDIDQEKISQLSAGVDPTGEVSDASIQESSVRYTAQPRAIADSDFVIITVPTPIDTCDNPDLTYVTSAGESVGRYLTPGATVILESTVFPGATETVLAPAIEEASGFTAGEEFSLGYSPERASPGDDGRGVSDVVKIVGANDDEVRESIATLYESIVDAGVYRAPDIQTAEAAKAIENVQRDVNIALMNELAVACDHMDLSSHEVLEAAGTKWNFHDEYSPGLVGGHCIPVDPHYFAHRSELCGFSPDLIRQARTVNESFPDHVADLTIKALNDAGNVLSDSDVIVLGLSYKPNVGDIRTSEVSSVIEKLGEFKIDVAGFDPHADPDQMRETFDFEIRRELELRNADGLVLATAHDEFNALDLRHLATEMALDPVLIDVPGLFDSADASAAGFTYRGL